MFEFEVLELLVKSLMLADLAHVVLFLKDAHATCNAWREMSATLLATDIKFIDDSIALWTVELLLLLVIRRVPGEQVDGQKFVCLSLILGDGIKHLQLDQGSAALSVTLVEE